MTDTPNFETAPDSSDVSAEEIADAAKRLENVQFQPEVNQPGDSVGMAVVEAGNAALSTELITDVPVASEGDGETPIPVRFIEPEGGYSDGTTTQPDYAGFARDATKTSIATNGLGATGELGDTAPRDDNARAAKNPTI